MSDALHDSIFSLAWGAINPLRLGFLVLAMVTVSSAGYLALRHLGPRLGMALTALAGGLVSSTATIAAMASKARDDPANAAAFAAAGLLSNFGTLVQIGVVVTLLCPALLAPLALPLLAAGVTTLAIAATSGWRAMGAMSHSLLASVGRPFRAVHVLAFVGLMAMFMLLGAVAQNWLGSDSLAWVSAASGLVDVHAAIASVAQLTSGQEIAPREGLQAMTAALASNSALKCTLAILRGGRRFGGRMIAGMGVTFAAFGSALLLSLGPLAMA